jgi:RNA polymerase sigma factor (sigma-70 family)
VVGDLARSERLRADLALPDAALLERFVRVRDESAFEALFHRHGALVYQACRRRLSDPNDAADAFQATFLVLARKAGSIGRRELLANWLYGVAARVAARARRDALRRQARQQAGADVERLPAPAGRAEDDLACALHEEVERLPGRYRAPVVLCYLQGKSQEEAAAELGCSAAAVKGRLALARQALRDRLGRRGLMLKEGDPPACPPVVPPVLVRGTLQVALPFAGGAAAGVPAGVLALTTEVLRAMWWSKWKVVTAVLLAGAILAGAGGLAYQALAGPKPVEKKKEPKPKDDREAILGVWVLDYLEYNGKKNPEELAGLKDLKITYTKDKETHNFFKGDRGKEYTYKLDPTKKPKAIDLEGDVSVEGVYALEGGRLKICMPNAGKGGGKRPDAVEAKAGDGRILIVLKRPAKEKPKE